MTTVTYDPSIPQIVAGAAVDNTYRAYVAAGEGPLKTFLAKLSTRDPATGQYLTYTIKWDDPLVNQIETLMVQAEVAAHAADTAINALAVYAAPSFYEEILKPTRASEDGGKLAASTLRQIVPGAT